MTTDLAALRTVYRRATLDEADVGGDPIAHFRRWLDEAIAAGALEPTAMTLATVDGDHRPSARVVLLKGLDDRGLTWFTNYDSRKGRELAGAPVGALCFFWPELERQVRVEGPVAPVDAEESDRYFASRPLGSRIGAWASPQSEAIGSRAEIERREADIRARFGDAVPRPPHWGGYRLMPDAIEFWQGRPSRLHDRLTFRRSGSAWAVTRLAP